MKKKTFIVQLLDSKKPSRTSFTQVEDANFYSNDTDASLIFIPHEDTFDFQSAKVVMFNRGDESLVERDMQVTTEEGRKVASYELPDEIISHWGQWVAQPVFISGGEIYSGAIVTFSVGRYLMDNRPPTLRDIIKVDELYSQLVTVMDEIAGKDVISAPEIILARGGENTLGERLDKEHNEVTAQLAQKVGDGTKAKLEDLDATVLSAIEGGEGTSFNLLSIPQDKSVTPEKTTFIEKGKNFIDKDNYVEGYSLSISTGAVAPLTGGAVTPHFPVPANTQMTQNFSYVICFYDESGNFISGLPQSSPFIERTFTTPANAVTARTAVWKANLMASYQMELGNVSTPYEEYRISLKNFKPPTRSLGQSEMKAPFGHIFNGRQIIVDWETKKISGNINSVYYDDTAATPAEPSFSIDILINAVSWFYLDLNDGKFKVGHKGQLPGNLIVIMEIYATSAVFYYYAPYRPAIRLINYTGQVLQYLNGREIMDQSIEENKLSSSVQSKLNTISENGRNRLFTLNDAYVAWENGEKFPVAFYGDSTTDGVGTTEWVGNVLGQDSPNENAYPKRMEEKLRQATGNDILRIYNAGFSGKTAAWGLSNFNDAFLETSAYSDVKMIGISWGINDRVLYSTAKAFRTGFKSDIRALIEKCYANNIQPFLVTTQMVISPGVDTTQSQYLLREATSIETIANEVKRELAVELNLELIDTHDFTERFVKHSQYSAQAIIPDKLHFGNVGHEFEAQLYFAKLYPKTNWINKSAQLDYTNQQIVTGVPENRLSMPTTFTDSFKVFANYAKADTVDTLIYKAYVFNNGDSLKTLKAFKSDVTSLTYVKVNGVPTTLDTLEKTISTLDIGLHTLEVYSGASATVDFKGFKLE